MYYIYHIKGVKIGCTNDIVKRMKEQGFDEYEILEEIKCIYLVSYREIALQKEYGYRIDTLPYYKSYERFVLANKIGKTKPKTQKQIDNYIKLGNVSRDKFSKKVVATNLTTNEEIIFNSQKETSRELNIVLRMITRVLKGGRKKTSGYTFRYL